MKQHRTACFRNDAAGIHYSYTDIDLTVWAFQLVWTVIFLCLCLKLIVLLVFRLESTSHWQSHHLSSRSLTRLGSEIGEHPLRFLLHIPTTVSSQFTILQPQFQAAPFSSAMAIIVHTMLTHLDLPFQAQILLKS
jgi:hypothetical protein